MGTKLKRQLGNLEVSKLAAASGGFFYSEFLTKFSIF